MAGLVAGNKNEITKDELAAIRRFVLGGGVFISPYDKNNFGLEFSDYKVKVDSGFICVDGYCAYSKGEKTFDFVRAATEQYWFIYAELNMSVSPNELQIKRVNNGRSTERTFRKDYLPSEISGVYQYPLWRVRVTQNGVVSATDLRNIDAYVLIRNDKFSFVLLGLPDYVYTKYSFDCYTGDIILDDADKIEFGSSMQPNVIYCYKRGSNFYEIYRRSFTLISTYYNRRVDKIKSANPVASVHPKNVSYCDTAKRLTGLDPVVQSNVTGVTQSNSTSNTKLATTAFVHNVVTEELNNI